MNMENELSQTEQDRKVALELLGLKFITGHFFLKEDRTTGSWIFASPKNKYHFLTAEPREEKLNFSLMDARGKAYSTTEAVEKTVEKDCKDVLFDNEGRTEYYSLVSAWREQLNDNNILTDFENLNLNDFEIARNPDILHDINSTLIKNLSVNPAYVSNLRENITQFVNAPRDLKPSYTTNLNETEYLTSIVQYSEQCNKDYSVEKISTQPELSL